jgi:hypothetical protein
LAAAVLAGVILGLAIHRNHLSTTRFYSPGWAGIARMTPGAVNCNKQPTIRIERSKRKSADIEIVFGDI